MVLSVSSELLILMMPLLPKFKRGLLLLRGLPLPTKGCLLVSCWRLCFLLPLLVLLPF